nr:hypothetical protein Itr_chr12CG27640 [Ipomoea trifida]
MGVGPREEHVTLRNSKNQKSRETLHVQTWSCAGQASLWDETMEMMIQCYVGAPPLPMPYTYPSVVYLSPFPLTFVSAYQHRMMNKRIRDNGIRNMCHFHNYKAELIIRKL